MAEKKEDSQTPKIDRSGNKSKKEEKVRKERFISNDPNKPFG